MSFSEAEMVEAWEKARLTGIGGWLYLIAFGTYLSPVFLFFVLAAAFSSGDAAVTAFVMFLFGFSVWIAYLFYNKSKDFPKWYIVSCVLTILIGWFTVVADQSVGIYNENAVASELGTTFGYGIWIAYMLRSKRVANTFVE